MRTVRIELFKAGELSGPALLQVLKDYRDINLDRQTWENTFYAEAEEIGVLISDGDITFIYDLPIVVNKILDKYPAGSDIFSIGTKFEYTFINDFDEADVLEFRHDLLVYFNGMIDKIFTDKVDIMTSNEAVITTLDNNGYEFTGNGMLYTVMEEEEWKEVSDGPRVTIVQI